MKPKPLLCLALVLGGGLSVSSCHSAIIYPTPPKAAKQSATQNVASLIHGFNGFGFNGVTNMAELTVTDTHRVYIAENPDVISGRLLSAAKPVTGWDYFIIQGTNAVGTVFLQPDKTNGTTLHLSSVLPPNPEIADALRTAEQLPHNKVNQAALETMLVEQFVMLSAVQWESFLNDLIVAYVMMRPQAALNNLESRIEKSVESKFGEHAANCTTFKVQRPFSRQKIVGLLDPKNWNITVTSAQELTMKANDLLVAEFAKKFSLNKNDAEFIDFAVAVRNFLSHRSEASRMELKNSVTALTEPANAMFNGQIRDVGTYLKTKDGAGTTRAVSFASRLIAISAAL